MRLFLIALSFLTALPLPLKEVSPEEFRRAAAFYPLVGYVLGGGLGLMTWLLSGLEGGLRGALLLALWLLLTGMLHLDGLLDLGDALFSPKPPEERRRILKDVHLGSFAFGVGFSHLLLKWQLLTHTPPFPLFLLPGGVRFLLLFLMPLFPAHPGLGERVRGAGVGLGAVFALPALLLFPLPLLFAFLGMLGLGLLAKGRLGGLSGDVYGAMIELGELLALLGFVLMEG